VTLRRSPGSLTRAQCGRPISASIGLGHHGPPIVPFRVATAGCSRYSAPLGTMCRPRAASRNHALVHRCTTWDTASQ
jgi:hypothetical protein